MLGNMGNAYVAMDEPLNAIQLFNNALSILRDIGDRRGVGTTLINLSSALERTGDAQGAIARAEEALATYESLGLPDADKTREWLARLRAAGG